MKYAYSHTLTILMAIFQVNPCQPVPLDFQSPMIPSILSILTGQAKTINIAIDTIPPSLLCSLSLHLHTSLEPFSMIFMFKTL